MIKHYLSKRKREIVLASVLSAASALASIVLLGYLNGVAGAGFTGGAQAAMLTGFGLVALMFVTSIVSQTYLARFGSSTIAELRRDLSEQYLNLDYAKLLEIGKHQVAGSLITDVGRIATLFLVLPLFFFNAVTVVFCFGYLLWLAPKLFGVFAVVMSFAIASSMLLMGRSGKIFEQIRDEEDKLFEYFRGIGEGKKELSLSRTRAMHFLDRVIQRSIEVNRVLGYEAQKWWNYGGTWGITMVFCALFAVIFVGAAWLGAAPVTIMQFVIVTLFLMNPLNYLIIASQDIAIGVASVKKLDSLGISADKPAPILTAHFDDWKRISARGLTYRYNSTDRHAFGFGPVDFELARGETVFVVGGNGSGKSTLALLLTSLLQPASGHIEVDGREVGAAERDAYRALFSAVFFDFYLFGHVIDRAGDAADDATANALLKKLDLSEKVQVGEGAFSTLDLSQGQRKRLALTQAYLDDGEIFLFDEWAADQDPEFKQYFYDELLPELKRRGKTVLAITHDEKYFARADRLVKLDQGRIVGWAREALVVEPA